MDSVDEVLPVHYYSVVTVQLFVQLWGAVVRYDGD